jgi:SAM-dependent methyltransferase
VDDWLTTNRRMWDERVPLHAASDFYDVEGFKAGRPALLPHEIDELGPLDGMRLAHLQCHFGLDTLDIARLHQTVTVTGLDFSAPAVDAATRLAGQLRLADRSRFVLGDVYRAAEILGHERFDVVYTGKGALLWLPDLDRWAQVVFSLLEPGGFLYLNELHPVAEVLGAGEPLPVRDYFATEAEVCEDPGSYAVPGATTVHNNRYQWQHPLSRVLTALLGAGLRLELFHEWDFALDDLHRWLVRGPDGRRRWPPGMGTLPLMYSLKAVRPIS